ncbi:TPA: hypothetical protein DHW58_01005 [Patescibacteria group bacterium]|uniref:Translation elongation factor-like protein n=2 Tax=Bacteria division Kazan-3B-28 TaxID=1798534 RepID=A0A0G1X6K0_UNCK3|nr:MAG: hypothetical protein VE98_C0001G0243 [candidate division Kazan bacterium GW2011_GWA1_50_15]KKW25482.1 MAG: hypothetical protein VE99_C0001G0119 [candidate division Kazan bacterium GW2011_GWC1_52_13]KKW26788.1 MAG: hypothetical protein VF00_C0002G0113 [candidate division Kazan bacterium GW2011_GWB1_52_7]HAV65783.1 hypothetical protein [Patescibacteria group bacterium]HCL47549.1 hypothetical protein [Patescibacteria group bacterium]
MADKPVGKVTHYYDKIGVAIVSLNSSVKLGDTLTFKKGEVEFSQPVESMQIERASVDAAKKGDVVGIQTKEPVKEGTEVYA